MLLQLTIVSVITLLRYALAYHPVIKSWTPEEIANFEQENSDSEHWTYLDTDNKYLLSWEYDNETITFDITVQAQGWAGLGFTSTHGMRNADIVFIWIDDNGKGRISDRHAKQNGYPEKDDQQDYKLLSATKTDSGIRAKFQRRRDTCDNDNDYVLTTDNSRVIWAFSETQPDDENDFEKHSATNRGVKGLFLFEPADVRVKLPTDTVTLDLLSDSTPLPTDHHLMYWCQMFEMPKWPVHHLIRLEALVEKGHQPYVHHVGVYQCSKNMSAYLNKGERCFVGDGFNFSKMYECTSKLFWFWNPGMKPSDLPDGVGLPLFESPADSYLMLEIHYENLELKAGATPFQFWFTISDSCTGAGIVDRSGLRMYLTPTLRSVDAGILYLGTPEQAPNQIIPPEDPEFHFFAHFDNCLAYLPASGINIIYALLHAHLYAKKIRMHHYRNGTQFPDYAVDENYDFYSQNFRYLNPPRHVLPGDELVLECIYDTTGTNETIYGGFSTMDEMCDATHFYYPRAAKGFGCTSFPDPSVYVPMFGGRLIDNSTVELSTNETATLYEFVKHHLDWNKPGIRQQYKEFLSNGQYSQEFYYQPLKNEVDVNSSEEPPVEHRVLTHFGFPKVNKAWVPEREVHDCASTEKAVSNGQLETQPEIPLRLIEKSHAKIMIVDRMVASAVAIVISCLIFL